MRPASTNERGTVSNTSAVGSEQGLGSFLASLWAQISSALSKVTATRNRGLRLCESLSLGEKRMLAIIECDHQRFLLAATPQSISLLQSLGPAQTGAPRGKSD